MPLSQRHESAKPTVLHWEDFQQMFLRAHKTGEHVSIVGPTGGGKTTIGCEVIKMIGSRRARDGRPARAVVICCKEEDDTIASLGWPQIKRWPPAYGEEHCMVWPRGFPASERARRQAAIVSPLLDEIYKEGRQTVYITEAAYVERPLPKGLGLSHSMEQLWSEARSSKLTVIADTQRPRHVTLLMWTEPSWVFVIQPEDLRDLDTVAQMSGQRRAVHEIVPNLGGYEFLCIRRQRSGQRGLYVSKVQ